jgi:hypothetical protein
MTYIPTTDEVRGTWNAMVGSPGGFDRWLATEHERIWNIIDKETFHYGKTHSGRTECTLCRVYLAIVGDDK